MNIPARFVSCYYDLEPRDSHAVLEEYLNGFWWLFDATRQAKHDGLVRIGVGRDAVEIAVASPFGNMQARPMKIMIELPIVRLNSTRRSAAPLCSLPFTDRPLMSEPLVLRRLALVEPCGAEPLDVSDIDESQGWQLGPPRS